MSVCRCYVRNVLPHSLGPTFLGDCSLCRATSSFSPTPKLRALIAVLAVATPSRPRAVPTCNETTTGDNPDHLHNRPEAPPVDQGHTADFSLEPEEQSWPVHHWKRRIN